ncbi:MAG: hypothetical protein K2P58_03280 [Hyphomonadaceae bacterium]|nr:hypothetical protein [Hyphomonadaceae bacterium]
MRLFVFALVAALAACAPTAPPRCDLEAARTIALTAPGAEDEIVAQAIGPACDKAVGLLVVRTAEGYPVWSWSAPISLRFGDVFAAQDREPMQAFLERWTDATLSTTGAAPDWSALAPGQTTLDQFTYDDIRARALPMLCHYSATARETCVFWEPAAGGAGHLYERDVEETAE